MNNEFIKNFNKMNFETDDIRVAIVLANDNRIVYEQPIKNLKISNTKTLWTLKADPSIFKEVVLTSPFYVIIYNHTVDNITITSTSLQDFPDDLYNDVTVNWNTTSGIVRLKKTYKGN